MFTRWLVFHVASGQAFFSGVACLIAAVGLSAASGRRAARVARNALVYVGAALVFASATPMPSWAYGGLALATGAWLVGEALEGKNAAGRRLVAARVVVAVGWLSAVLVEVPHHRSPGLPRLGRPTLGILGDSLTAGAGGRPITTWPVLFAKRHGVAVRDHSVMGAKVSSAMEQAAALGPEERLVLLEIGGNDILGSTTPGAFEAGLSGLLATVCRPGRVVVMLELPLPPTYNAFGRIQRRLARRYGVRLVPKRVLIGVLQRPGATLDTIHLSGEGHGFMADAMWRSLRGAYVVQ